MRTFNTINFIHVVLSVSICFYSCDGKANRIEAEKAYIAAVDAYEDEQYAGSLEHVRHAIKLDRNFYQASFLEGKILFFSGEMEQAQKIFSKLSSRYPAFIEAKIWNIRCLIIKGDLETAKKLLDKELSYNQTDWRIYSLYSLVAQKENNYEERLAMNRKAESMLTDSAGVYIDMAIIWRTIGLKDRAQIYLKKAQIVSDSNISISELEGALNQLFQE